jgi:hypothetical protein
LWRGSRHYQQLWRVEASCPEIEVFPNLPQDRSTSTTDQAMSPLRRRMIEDMTIRKFAPMGITMTLNSNKRNNSIA